MMHSKFRGQKRGKWHVLKVSAFEQLISKENEISKIFYMRKIAIIIYSLRCDYNFFPKTVLFSVCVCIHIYIYIFFFFLIGRASLQWMSLMILVWLLEVLQIQLSECGLWHPKSFVVSNKQQVTEMTCQDRNSSLVYTNLDSKKYTEDIVILAEFHLILL